MQSRDAKMKAMDAAAREQRDMITANRLLTPMQMAARRRRDGALETIRAMPPQDQEVGEAGISRARVALAEGCERARERERN